MSSPAVEFDPDKLTSELVSVPDCPHYWIGFSGGLDSTVLVHAVSRFHAPFIQKTTALYIDHQLHPDSASWKEKCQSFCQTLGIPFRSVAVDVELHRHLGPEGAARAARYQAILQLMNAGDGFISAHHSDDQIETVLLQLLRGAGPHGLAGMPKEKRLGPGVHLRPLLSFSRTQLYEYAQHYALSWVDDPANASLKHDRNFVRHQLAPLLKQRWPHYLASISRAAQWQSECVDLQDDLASIDTDHELDNELLSVDKLRRLPNYRVRNALRAWIRHNGFSLPGRRVLDTLVEQAMCSNPDATPVVHWPDCEVRQYRLHLYIMSPLSQHDAEQQYVWNIETNLELPGLNIVLDRALLSTQLVTRPEHKVLTVRFRNGGERIRIQNREGTHALKKIFQEIGIPPWQRDRIPLIYDQEKLLVAWGTGLKIDHSNNH